MEYRAVRNNPNDELKHWKYIKRIKQPSGKYKYIYDPEQELTKYRNNTTIISKSPNGIKTHKTTYEQTDDWLDSKSEVKVDYFILDNGQTVKVGRGDITYKQGRLSRAIAKGEKWIFDNLISDKKKTASQRKKKKK